MTDMRRWRQDLNVGHNLLNPHSPDDALICSAMPRFSYNNQHVMLI